jgi:hypothetical protein
VSLLSSIGLPHGLIFLGVVFVVMGFLGLSFTRNQEAATSDRPVSRHQLLPPKLFDSSSRKGTDDDAASGRAGLKVKK